MELQHLSLDVGIVQAKLSSSSYYKQNIQAYYKQKASKERIQVCKIRLHASIVEPLYKDTSEMRTSPPQPGHLKLSQGVQNKGDPLLLLL